MEIADTALPSISEDAVVVCGSDGGSPCCATSALVGVRDLLRTREVCWGGKPAVSAVDENLLRFLRFCVVA